MATLGNYYIDAADFSNASAVWTNSTFTTKAPDGWYQSCGVVRRQVSGLLEPPNSCVACNPLCEDFNYNFNYFGVYNLEVELGTGLGAVPLRLSPSNIPNAMYVTYKGITYNEYSIANFGYGVGYVGRSDKFTDYGFPAGSPYSVPVFQWDGGAANAWSPTGAQQTLVIAPADTTSITAPTVPGVCHMYVPKVDIDPQTITVQVRGAVGAGDDTWSFEVDCPQALTGFSASDLAASSIAACALALTDTYYLGPVNGTATNIQQYDWVFADENAEVRLANAPGKGAGYYHYNEGGVDKWFEIDTNSIIINLGNC